MTLNDILARADEPVWTADGYPYKMKLPTALFCASIGEPLYLYGERVGTVTQELLDAVEARDANP